jgi:hypothetical protein
MTGELKGQLREVRSRLRSQMRASKERVARALEANPQIQKIRRRRRIQRTVAVIALLLLLLLIRCEGQGVPETPVPTQPVPTEPPKPKVASVAKTPPTKRFVPVRPVERPGFSAPVRPPAGWLDVFRLQVAARSPRLAACFNGTDRPGALKWTSLVSLQTGAVGSHEFEPLGLAAEVSETQLTCLKEVLSKPGYRLGDEDVEGLPERVSLVLEF